VRLTTARLVLRPPTADDVPAIVDGCSDPDVARYIPVLPVPYTEADARWWLDTAPRRWDADRERAFAITIPPSDELMGVISVERRPGGVIGYWLHARARGRGLMTEALIAVAEWADVRGLHLNAHEDNVASQRVAEKAGFVRVGLVPHDPPFHDGRADAVRYER
jgi:RimJ/RimL family protein N-acetyltransferase